MRPAADPLSIIDTWLAGHRRFVIAAVVVLSIALRIGVFTELARGPFLSLDQWTETDMHYYDTWARAIAGGDWWSASVEVPMHQWHTLVARVCLPTQPAGTTAQQLWTQWNGPHVFYQDSLYPYLVALTYRVFGASARFAIAWQLAIGVLTNVLILLITWRYFGATAGALAALLATLCGPLLSYELLLLRDSMVVAYALAMVWMAGGLDRRKTLWWVIFGLMCGLAPPLKSTLTSFSIALMAGALIGGAGGAIRIRRALALCAGLAGPVLLLVTRNAVVGAPLFALTGNGAITFVASNNVNYPVRGGFSLDVDEIGNIMCRTGGRLLPAMASTLREHTVGSYASVLWHKFDQAWFWYEVPNNANFYYLRLHSAVLSWMPVTFLVLAPLGLVGLVLALRNWRQVWPLYVLVAWSVTMLTAFLVTGRLRAVLVGAMIPFAAATLVYIARSARRWPAIAAIVVIALWTGRPLVADVPLIPVTDWFTPYWVTYEAQVTADADKGDTAGAARALGEFLQYEPDFAQMDRSNGQLVDAGDRDAARAFAKMHAERADFLERSGQPREADAEHMKTASLMRLSGTPFDR